MSALEQVEEIGSAAIAGVYGRWTEQLLDGDPDPRTVRKRLAKLRNDSQIAQVVFEGRLRGIMLGFLGGVSDVGVVKLQDTRTTPTQKLIVEKPLNKAAQAFRERVPVTRASWDAMSAKERRRAFTVSGLATNDYVGIAQGVVTEALDKGWDRKDFVAKLEARFQEAGLDPLNPSHAETVFRTNVATAHAQGRMTAFTQPAIMKVRPLLLWTSIVDKTSRKTHAAMHGLAMATTDPAWQRIAPPAGFRCRCSVTAIRASAASQIVTGSDPRVAAMPDEDWEGSGMPGGLFEVEDLPAAAE